jgi:hypothetical protein
LDIFVFLSSLCFGTDDIAMQEASACFRDELKTLVELASNFRDDVDTLKDEVTGRGKLHDVSVPSSEETNSVINKLKGENLMLKIECGFLREENVELSNRCVQALNGSLNTQHDAVKKMMDDSILKKNNMVEDTRGMVDPIQAPQKEVDALRVQPPLRRSPRRPRAGH